MDGYVRKDGDIVYLGDCVQLLFIAVCVSCKCFCAGMLLSCACECPQTLPVLGNLVNIFLVLSTEFALYVHIFHRAMVIRFAC